MTKDIDQKTGPGKVCTKCGEWKLLEEYHKHKGSGDGHSVTCKGCAKAITRAWREANPERAKASVRAYREAKKSPELAAKREAQSEAAKSGLKICTKCNLAKPFDGFSRSKSKKDGLVSWCKECVRPAGKLWKESNRDKVNASSRAHYARVPLKRREAHEKWKANNPEKMKEAKRRCRTTPKGKIEANVRGAIHKTITKGMKHAKTFIALGYTPEELMAHLEDLFLPGMTWENYGDWHIDHIIPLAVHNYSSTEDFDFKRAWALSNLQPLWAHDNIAKGAKIEKPFQPSLSLVIHANDNIQLEALRWQK